MTTKKTMTLNLNEQEMEVLEAMCKRYDMNKTALMKKAFRMFLIIDQRLQKGEKLFAEDEKENKKAELVVL